MPSACSVNEATNETATGVIGLAKADPSVIDLSFDILSLEALFLVPRQEFLWVMHVGHRADTGQTGSARS